mgnify:CR=1 FL=1
MSNVRKIRERLQLTQLQVAEIFGVTKSSVSIYLSGRHEIPPDAARKLIAAAAERGFQIGFDDIYSPPAKVSSCETAPEKAAA